MSISFQFHYLRSQLKKSKVQIILVEAVNTEIRFNRFKPVQTGFQTGSDRKQKFDGPPSELLIIHCMSLNCLFINLLFIYFYFSVRSQLMFHIMALIQMDHVKYLLLGMVHYSL